MHGDRYHEAMAVYDWICIVDPPKGARTMQRVYELVAFISTTFQHRPEASQQLHTLLEKDPRSKRKKRVRDHQKWHSANTQKQGGGSGGHGGALAMAGVAGFDEGGNAKEEFAQIWHEAAHLAMERKHIEAFNLWAVLAQLLDYAKADATEAFYNWCAGKNALHAACLAGWLAPWLPARLPSCLPACLAPVRPSWLLSAAVERHVFEC